MMTKDTMALIHHLNWTPVHIIGNSLGGMVALELASAFPDTIRSLSLLSTTSSLRSYNRNFSALNVWTIVKMQDQSLSGKLDSLLFLLYPESFLQENIP